jgi:PAS domain S-box-containing protein
MLGYRSQEYIGHHMGEFHVGAAALDSLLSRLASGETLHQHPGRMRGKDGAIREVLITASPLIEAGKLVHTRCVTVDVTEQHRAREASALLAAIVDSSDDAIVSKSLDGTILSWNTGAERLFGYVAAEAVGKPITFIIPKELHDEERAILERLRQGEKIDHFETVRVAKDGTRVDISLTISPVRDGRGRIVGASKIARNITERKLAEERLLDSEERYRRLTELLPVAVYTCEAPSGLITYYNERAAELWGRSPTLRDPAERFCGSVRLFKPDGSYLPHEHCPMAAAVREGRSFRNREVMIERPDGSRITALVNIEPILDAEGRIVAAINACLDVSALKRAERQLKEADRRKDEFLATLSHELRNPLAPLRYALELIERAGDDGRLLRQSRKILERQVGQMVRLIDDLLDVSRITHDKLELRKESVDLAAVVRQAIETSRPLIDEAGHELIVHLPDQPVRLQADAVRLAQVLANLLSNACKYTEPGGVVRIAAERHGDEVLLSVKDSGEGIPAGKLGSIFEMFTQADPSSERSQGGLGVGLTLVRRLVEMHGGSVRARSDGPGLGSEFVVRLPAAAEAQKASASEQPAPVGGSSSVSPTAHRILVVDDNRDSAASLAALLDIAGHETLTAHDGPGAIDAAESFRPDVVLLDLGLPKMDGYAVCRTLRRQPWGQDIILLALTGWGQEEDRRKSRDAGFDDHLVKPVDHTTILELVASRTLRPSSEPVG